MDYRSTERTIPWRGLVIDARIEPVGDVPGKPPANPPFNVYVLRCRKPDGQPLVLSEPLAETITAELEESFRE